MKALGYIVLSLVAAGSWGYIYHHTRSRPVAAVQIDGPKVENFALFDHQGGFFDLSRKRHLKGLVLISHGCECPMVRKQIPYLESLKSKYAAQGIEFYFINPQDAAKDIVEEAAKFGITLPVLLDDAQIIARGLQLTRTLEAILIDAKSMRIVYRGAINDEFSFDGDKAAPKHEFLVGAVENFLGGRGQAIARTELTGGCAYSFNVRDKVTYSEHVRGILERNCTTCHTDSGVPPTKMAAYQDVQRWGPMIREVIRTNRMPPALVDPNFGPYPKINLPATDRAALVNWVESGMAEGPQVSGKIRQPAQAQKSRPFKGDLSFAMREGVQVPPKGKFLSALYPISEVVAEDTWVEGIKLMTADASQVHDIDMMILPNTFAEKLGTGVSIESNEAKRFARREGNLIPFASGSYLKSPVPLPKDTAVLIPKGSVLMLGVHHFNTGKVETFKEGVAMKSAKCGRAYTRLHFGGLYNWRVRVPANTPEHHETASETVERDIRIHQVHFHMHKRGRKMKLSFRFPNGEIHPVVSVPNYRMGPQHPFPLKPAMSVPRGSELMLEAVYDNSAGNPAIDSPNYDVREGGDPDTEEMMKLAYLYTVDGEPPYFRKCQ